MRLSSGTPICNALCSNTVFSKRKNVFFHLWRSVYYYIHTQTKNICELTKCDALIQWVINDTKGSRCVSSKDECCHILANTTENNWIWGTNIFWLICACNKNWRAVVVNKMDSLYCSFFVFLVFFVKFNECLWQVQLLCACNSKGVLPPILVENTWRTRQYEMETNRFLVVSERIFSTDFIKVRVWHC